MHTLQNIIAKKKKEKKKKQENGGGIKNTQVICNGGEVADFVKLNFWFCLVPERCPIYLYRNEGINCIILDFKKTSNTEAIGGEGGGAVRFQTVGVNIRLL